MPTAEKIERVPIDVKVNGKSHALEVEPRTLLVELLRETLDLTGTHVGCDAGAACRRVVRKRAVARFPHQRLRSSA